MVNDILPVVTMKPPPGYYDMNGTLLTIQEVIGEYNAMYMRLILAASSVLFILILYNNFILDTKHDILRKYNIDTDELMIIPGVILMIVTLAYEGII